MPTDPGRLLLAKLLVSSRRFRALPPPEPSDPIWRWRDYRRVETCRDRRALAVSLYLGHRQEQTVAGRHWTARVNHDGRVTLVRADRAHRCPPSMRVKDPRREGRP